MAPTGVDEEASGWQSFVLAAKPELPHELCYLPFLSFLLYFRPACYFSGLHVLFLQRRPSDICHGTLTGIWHHHTDKIIKPFVGTGERS